MFDLGEVEQAKSPLYDWRPQSTYIRRPPYWEGALAAPRTLANMRPLAILGDNITTDHLSPSNAILMDSAAGEYLHKMGVPEEDFNSYATHRGDHLTAQRATFANPKFYNEIAFAVQTVPPDAASLGELLLQGKNNLDAPWLALSGFLALLLCCHY